MNMEKRRLGRTNLTVSVVGVGTLGFPRQATAKEEAV